MNNTPDKRACDGHFPLPVKGKAIPSHRALRSPTEPFRALRSPMCTPATEPCGVPRESFSSTGKGEKWIAGTPGRPFPRPAGRKGTRKRTPCSHDCRFLDRQGGKGIASARHVPMITFSSTGRGKRPSQAHKLESRMTYSACLSMRSVFSAPHRPRVPRDQAKSIAITRIIRYRKLAKVQGKTVRF